MSAAFVVAGVVILLVLAVAARAGLAQLVGPVFLYDVIRSSRRGRFFLYRTLYAGGMLLLLLWIWLNLGRHSNLAGQLEGLGEIFFGTCATVQFVAVCLLTPGAVAGCIAEEKGSRTIEFLLATDLNNREIVLGKSASRVGALLMVLLAGLPVLSLMQFFGGIDPAILLLTYAATGLTLLSLTGISVVQSVQRRRGRDAIQLAYLTAAAYLGVSWMLSLLQGLTAAATGTWLGAAADAARPVIDVIRWGDPLRAYSEARSAISASGPRGPEFLRILGEYAAFHGSVFVAGLSYAVWRLRPIALKQASLGDGTAARRRRNTRRPDVFENHPMVWKEVYAERTYNVGRVARLTLRLLPVLAFVPLVVIAVLVFGELSVSRMSVDGGVEAVNNWLRGVNAFLGSLMVIAIAVRAAGSVGGERDRDTLPSLLTTPLSAGEILFGKFVGAGAGLSSLAYWLAAAWGIAIVFSAVNPLTLLAEPIALAPPAAAAAAAGLYFSVRCRTTLRALVATVLAVVLGLGGHWLLGCSCCFAPMAFAGGPELMTYVGAYLAGATPPLVLAIVPMALNEDWLARGELTGHVMAGVGGLMSWSLVAVLLYSTALARFARATNRAGPTRPGVPG